MASRATYRVDAWERCTISSSARLRRRPARSGMSIARGSSGHLVAALVVIGGFTYLQVGEERSASSRPRAARRRAGRRPRGSRGVRPGAGQSAGARASSRKVRSPEQGLAFSTASELCRPRTGAPPVLSQAMPEGDGGAWPARRRGAGHAPRRPQPMSTRAVLRDDRLIGACWCAGAELYGGQWRLWRDNGDPLPRPGRRPVAIALLIVRITVVQPLTKMLAGPRRYDAARAGRRWTFRTPVSSDPWRTSVGQATSSPGRAAAEEEAVLRLVGERSGPRSASSSSSSCGLATLRCSSWSNREPLSHVWKDGRIEGQRPAPVLSRPGAVMARLRRGVGGAGQRDADREMSDERGRMGLPQDDPRYSLAAGLWLSKAEEAGYY